MWRGPPYRLLHVIRSQHEAVQIYSSPALLEEFTDVITRPAFWKRLNLIGKTPHELLADYLGIIELIEPVEAPRLELATTITYSPAPWPLTRTS
jgi:hypothetical protein